MAMINGTRKINLGMVIAIYLFGIFMGAIDTGIVTPARTIIQNNLSVGEKTGIWMITIYTLAYAASIPVMGKLADKYGRKYVYLTSIFLFGLGSLFCGLSQDFGSFGLMLAARAVQAVGGGGIMPVATAEFGTSFPVEKRGMALGLVGGVYGIANIFGSSVGSAILDIFGTNNWQFIFYINLPITLFVVIAGLIFLPNTKAEEVKKIDKFGILLIVVMVLSLLYGLRNIDFFDFVNTFLSRDVYPFLLLFLLLLPVFILAERKAEDPIINLHYFSNGRIVVTLLVGFIVGIVMMGMIFVPQFAENSLEIASGSGGYFVIILGVFTGISAPLSGKLVDKYGAKKVLAAGFLITVAGSLFLIFVTTSHPDMLNVCVSLLLIGFGLGFTMGAPLNYMMLENTRKEESNSALATLSLVRSIGTTIAPAIMVGFLAHAGTSVQDKVMAVLPSEIASPALPYAQELSGKINKMKSDPNMKDKLENVEIPDLSAKTAIKIDMNGNANYKMPGDLIELMKTSDVTNITERAKILASRMFSEMTPEIISNIQNGVEKGIKGMESGLPEMVKSVSDLQKGYDGLTEAIKGMNDGIEGIGKAIGQMEQAVRQQKSALAQMKKIYSQMGNMTANTGEMSLKADGMPANIGGKPANIGGKPAGMGDMSTGAGKPDLGVGAPEIKLIDMIPPQVKSSLPVSVLEQLKAVKTPADLNKKIKELEKAINTLNMKAGDLKKQREDLQARIQDAQSKQKQMNDAIESISTAEVDLKDTIDKMHVLYNSVKPAFEKVEKDYLVEIDNLSPKIKQTFKDTLNVGFKQVYMTAAIASLLAILVLAFYRRKKLKNV